MKNIVKLICLFILLSANNSFAAGGAGPIFHMNVDTGNQKSLQRGAKIFVNYCLSCHEASYSRYNRVAADLGISEANMRDNMIFTGKKIGDTMTVAMTAEQGKEWFGVVPPDLSVKARARGADWIYSFLKSFYLDDGAARGINNKMLTGTSMPHVLWELQGFQKLKADDHHADDSHAHDGHGGGDHSPFVLAVEGQLSEAEYDKTITDLVNFLVYLSEPAQLQRKSVGVGVLFFLFTLGVFAYFLKKDYWKDIH